MSLQWWRRSLSALPAAVAGGALSSLLVAGLDARVAARDAEVAFGSVYPAAFGLVAPFVVLLGIAARLVLVATLPEGVWAATRAWLRPNDAATLRERSALLLLSPLFAGLWLVVSARVALGLLASQLAAPAVGVGLALSTLALAALFGLAAQGLSRGCRELALTPQSPAPVLAGSLALVTLVLAYGVLTGAPSGAGGPLAMLGVLNRDELDLRPVGLLLLGVAGPLLLPASPRRALSLAYLALVLLPLAGLLHAARVGLAARTTSLAIERAAPLSAKLLSPLRRLSDRDRDGFAALFGGGDCNDAQPDVNPSAVDLPENGLDEDCSGADERKRALPAPKPAPVANAVDAAKARLPARLNVVLLTIDTLRYDLGYAGNPRPLSPGLDRLASESVVFERAYALASYTAKSLPPMLIGRYAGETHRGYSHFNRFDKNNVFLAERLQRAGVATASVQGHWYFFKNFGLERGFDLVDSSAAPRAAQDAEGDRSVTSALLSDAVLAQLTRLEQGTQPFFLWAHYTDPHAEYVKHEGFDFGPGSRAAYDAEVAFVDHHVARVLERLRAAPHAENTALIVTSDHGEAFGEHAMIRHGFELWEELVRVPLIVRVPGFAAARIAARRSTIDLVPTVLELMRKPLPEADGSDALSGQSLLADLALAPGETPSQRPIFVDMSEGPHNAERRAYIADDQKLVTSRGRVLGLYDLGADPGEKRDLASDPKRVAPVLEGFQAFRRTLREVVVRPP